MKNLKPDDDGLPPIIKCFICAHPELESDLEAFKDARTLGLKFCKEHQNEIDERAPLS